MNREISKHEIMKHLSLLFFMQKSLHLIDFNFDASLYRDNGQLDDVVVGFV